MARPSNGRLFFHLPRPHGFKVNVGCSKGMIMTRLVFCTWSIVGDRLALASNNVYRRQVTYGVAADVCVQIENLRILVCFRSAAI